MGKPFRIKPHDFQGGHKNPREHKNPRGGTKNPRGGAQKIQGGGTKNPRGGHKKSKGGSHPLPPPPPLNETLLKVQGENLSCPRKMFGVIDGEERRIKRAFVNEISLWIYYIKDMTE